MGPRVRHGINVQLTGPDRPVFAYQSGSGCAQSRKQAERQPSLISLGCGVSEIRRFRQRNLAQRSTHRRQVQGFPLTEDRSRDFHLRPDGERKGQAISQERPSQYIALAKKLHPSSEIDSSEGEFTDNTDAGHASDGPE
jgi:hypothetical protein